MRRLPSLIVLLAITSLAASAHAQAEKRVRSVEIEGRLLDPKEKLIRFLGLSAGAVFDEHRQDEVFADLEKLGYRRIDFQTTPTPEGIDVKLRIEPMRVVRTITVHGNWPLFDDEVLRHLSVRSGDKLPRDDELAQFLLDEADRVRQFLERDGYFGGEVKILPRRGPREDWVDLDVRIKLGDWYRITQVVPTGNHAIKESELFNIFANHCCFRWGRFEVQRMRDDAREAEKVLRERGYPAARVTPEFDFARDADPNTRRIKLPIKVVEKRKVEVKFIGNRALTDKELKDQLTIFTSGAYDDIELADSARAVQRYYQQHGYFEAKVTFRRQKLSAELEEVDFLVGEGPELKVRAIEIVSDSGAPLSYTTDEIRTKAELETKVFPLLGVIGLGAGGYVTNVQLSQDIDRILDFYKKRGFPTAKVHAEVARDPGSFGALGALGAEAAGAIEGRDDLYVRFYVDEGRRELVDDVQIAFVGPHQESEANLRKRLKLARGSAYTDAAFADDGESIIKLYASTGRPNVQVSFADSKWNAAHDRYLIVYRIEEDGAFVFGEIMIRGNFKTLDRVILKDLPFKPGDRFDVTKIEEGERNLRTHLIFNSVRVQPLNVKQRNPVPVLVTVQERYLEKFGTLGLAGGVQTDKLPYYVYLQAGWMWGNFAGLGSQIELRFDTGFSDQSLGVQLRYTDLRAFGPGWRHDATGFWRRDITQRLGPVETYGLSLALTRNLSPTLRVFGRYDIYRAQISVGLNRIDGPNDLPNINDNTTTAKAAFGVVWDRRVGADGFANPLAPVKGWLLSAQAGYASPYLGGDHQFFFLSGQAIGILPFKVRSAEFTLMGNLRYDQGIPIGESALPLVERYFAGGDTSTRGYDTDQLKTEIIRAQVSPLSGIQAFRVIPQGGNIRMLSTIEFQFPIAKRFLGVLPFPWVGAIFYDAGAVVDALNLVGWSDIKHSVGLALLRVLTPVGPLSFEYAYPLTQSLAEERWKTSPWYSHYPGRFHFNWGIPLSR